MPNYHVEVYTRAAAHERGGVDPFTAELYSETSAEDWPQCLRIARVMARAYPHFIVSVCDRACKEIGSDGLTDEQRMEVFECVDEARNA